MPGCFLTIFFIANTLVVSSNIIKMKILHVSNFDGFEEMCELDTCVGGVSRLITAIKNEKIDDTTLVFLTGDASSSSTWQYKHGINATAAIMNEIGIDAACLGGRDFEMDGIDSVNDYLDRINFTYVCATIDLRQFSDNIQPATVIEKDSYKIGVIGHLAQEQDGAQGLAPIVYFNPILSINIEANKLRKGGVKTIVLLTNAESNMQEKIVEYCGLIDLVIGPGSSSYPHYVARRTGKNVPIILVPSGTLGSCDISINSKTGRIVESSGVTIELLSDIEADPVMSETIKGYQSGVDSMKENRIGRCNVDLSGPVDCAIKECNFGNMIADAFVETSMRLLPNGFAPIAVVSNAIIARGINPNDQTLTEYDLVNSLMRMNRLVVMKIRGADLMNAILAGCLNEEGFVQVSGLRLDLKNTKYNRVVSAYVRSKDNGGYDEFDENEWYTVITNQNSLSKFHYEDNDAVSLPITDLMAISWYIKSRKVIYPGKERRITIR